MESSVDCLKKKDTRQLPKKKISRSVFTFEVPGETEKKFPRIIWESGIGK